MPALQDPLADLLAPLGLTEEDFQENLAEIKSQVQRGLSDVDLGEDNGGEPVRVTLRTAKELLRVWQRTDSESEEDRTDRLLSRWDKDDVVELHRAQYATPEDRLLDAWAARNY